MSNEALEKFFIEIGHGWSADAALWPPDEDPARYGLEVRGDAIVPTAPRDPLIPEDIRAAMSADALSWLRDLKVLPVVGSTNAEMMRLAQHQSVAGSVWLAEVQLQGRGRRGRTWFSPFGANLAMSIGLAIARPPAELGGASLVVGLAVLDALEQLGIEGLSLKWPNDVLLRGSKLGGILIEMNTAGESGVELVVGIGLNVALSQSIREALDQQVSDLASGGCNPGRSAVAGRVVSTVVTFLRHFEQAGFAAFVEAFDSRHQFHGQTVAILQGDHEVGGRVAGVSRQGGLILTTPTGIQEFQGGEVTMRRGG